MLHLPQEVVSCIADQLETRDRVRLAATCRSLRDASVFWFRSNVFPFEGHLTRVPPKRMAWLQRVQAQVSLTLPLFGDLRPLVSWATAGVRLGALGVLQLGGFGARLHLPAELAGLTQLSKLTPTGCPVKGGWQHLPRQLQQLDLNSCSLQQVPAELAALTQLSGLGFFADVSLQGGWQHLPQQLQQLDLRHCDLEEVPPRLGALMQLSELLLHGSAIDDGWQHLPRQLQRLELNGCCQFEVPAALAGLDQLSELSLAQNDIKGGWQRLPRQLQQLDLRQCGLRQVPAALADLAQLSELSLVGNRIKGGWQHLPQQLQRLRLAGCGLQQLPAELAGRGLDVTGCDGEAGADEAYSSDGETIATSSSDEEGAAFGGYDDYATSGDEATSESGDSGSSDGEGSSNGDGGSDGE